MHTNFSDERIDAFIDKYRTWFSLQPENQRSLTPEAVRAAIRESSDGLTREDVKAMRQNYEAWFNRQPSDVHWNYVSPAWFRVLVKGDPLRKLPESQLPTYPHDSIRYPPTRLVQKREKEWGFNDEKNEPKNETP